ncbi:MAG: prepilin-type N-terminal cleavage/methylation domain-containing protein [Pseudomonadota bacterium]
MLSKSHRAITLIELMITLAIIVIILSLAIITMRGYIPKQRLVSSAGTMENALRKAQTEANARGYWTCVRFSDPTANPLTVEIHVDTAGSHANSETACQDGALLNTTQLRTDVQIASGSECTSNITTDCILWFNTAGSPKICSNSGSCGGTAPASGCEDFSYQIVLSTPNLESMARAREVEALIGGMIQAVKPTEPGLLSTLYASAPGTATAGGCE